MKVSYPELFPSGNLLERKFFFKGESYNSLIFARFILSVYYVCLYVLVCD
jgi:hypothetical protein